jgi:hypothetical protein
VDPTEGSSRQARPDPRSNTALVETDFVALDDGTLLELVEDPKNPGRHCFAVWQGGGIRLEDRFERDGQVFVPSRDDQILRCMQLPRGAESYESVEKLVSDLEFLISLCVAIDEKYVPVLANFVLSTWFVDRFLVAPYLSVVGLPQSGKTTLLRLLKLVCRRSLLVSDISSASLYWACARFMATILIDETGTAGNNRALRHILRAGTTRDVLAIRTKDHLHSYGAKVISWLEPPDDPALNSRCILIPMFENRNVVLMGIEELTIQQRAIHLRAQLLRFRLENIKTVRPEPVSDDYLLRPRARDLLRALSAATAQDAMRCRRLLKFFQSGQASPSEPLSPAQNAVLRWLFEFVHPDEIKEYSSLRIAELTEKVNQYLKAKGEGLQLQPRKVGAVLTSLGFCSRTRTNTGWTLQLTRQDAERIHQLAGSYGIDRSWDRALRNDQSECTLCKTLASDKEEFQPSPTAITAAVRLR